MGHEMLEAKRPYWTEPVNTVDFTLVHRRQTGISSPHSPAVSRSIDESFTGKCVQCLVPQLHTYLLRTSKQDVIVARLFLFLCLGTLDLCCPAQGLLSVLALLALLSAGTLGLGSKARLDKSVLGLELLQSLGGVVDECEAGGLATTEVGAQAKDLDLFLLDLVQAAELLAQLGLGDVGTARVEDVNHHLFAAK